MFALLQDRKQIVHLAHSRVTLASPYEEPAEEEILTNTELAKCEAFRAQDGHPVTHVPPRATTSDVPVMKSHFAIGGPQRSVHRAQRRGLSGAVMANDADNLTSPYLEMCVEHDWLRSIPGPQVRDLKDRTRVAVNRLRCQFTAHVTLRHRNTPGSDGGRSLAPRNYLRR